MAMQSSRLPPEPDATHVWRQLDADRRQQAISVVAQMAFNWVKTRPESLQQESDDASTTSLAQAPQ